MGRIVVIETVRFCWYECDVYLFFFKQKTAYEMRISDWSSDVCSSDLVERRLRDEIDVEGRLALREDPDGRCDRELGSCLGRRFRHARERAVDQQIGRASCRGRVCQYV